MVSAVHLACLAMIWLALLASYCHADDWPMLGHEPARSGATSDQVRPPFVRKWYRVFPEEGINTGVQPIVFSGRVYLGTLHGVLHAMDAETGKDARTFQAGGPILHAAAAGDGRIVFGCADGGVYAIDSDTGKLSWKVQTGAAVWNAPVVWNHRAYVGSRDGKLYGIDMASGRVLWTARETSITSRSWRWCSMRRRRRGTATISRST